MARKKKQIPASIPADAIARTPARYDMICADIVRLLETARRVSARAINSIMTATYWEIGRRIVEYEQKGSRRAGYGEQLLTRLSQALTARYEEGFSIRNLRSFRMFYQSWPIRQTVSAESGISPTPSAEFSSAIAHLQALAERFPLPWSHYVLLLSVKNTSARAFYETEALRGGWSVRQLKRQIDSLFYERTALSRNKAAMLTKGAKSKPEDIVTPEEEIKDPLVLEFLGLKDEYSEGQLEEALIRRLEDFLLELGGDFAFVGRQRRLRVGDTWYRVDLLFFHRRLRALVIVDLKIGEFTHADAGQMHLYLNYAREHWTNEGENPPVGVILCTGKDAAVVHYALEGLPNKILAAEYRLALPDEKVLANEIERVRKALESRRTMMF